MKPNYKIEYPDAPETPYASTGYVRLPEAKEILRSIEKSKRAPQPSPLLVEYMKKNGAKDERK